MPTTATADRAYSTDPLLHQGLVFRIAQRFAAPAFALGLTFNDLVQAGNVGLAIARDRYDPSRGTRFTTCAYHWIRNRIGVEMERGGFPIRVPKRVREAIEALDKGDPPQRSLLPETIVAGRRVLNGERFGETDIIDPLACDPGEPGDETPQLVAQLLGRLPKREAEVLRLRFGLEGREVETLDRIGQRYGVSKERIRQLERAAIGKLREMMGRDGL